VNNDGVVSGCPGLLACVTIFRESIGECWKFFGPFGSLLCIGACLEYGLLEVLFGM